LPEFPSGRYSPGAGSALDEALNAFEGKAGVRGAESLARLPEAERQAWQKLWDDVAALLARAQTKPAPEKKSR
jgi:hypothetical protein